MRCPECHSLNEDAAAACSNCGLLLLNVAPKRRAEDYAVQKRRAADRSMAPCPYCGGDVAADAPRCRHCSEIINEDYFRKRAQRMRSRINYASWVAYLFGLAALLVFRPVGVVSIAAGLLLSILYYAIPVDPPAPGGKKKQSKLSDTLRKQFKLERVAISLPAFRNRKLIFVGTPLVAALIGYSANLFLLQEPVNDILRKNASFAGMDVSAHYQYWVVPGVVVYDLRALSVRQTPIDVHTAFLEFAKELKQRRYSEVELSYKGTKKFSIDGASFSRLGNEYEKRNFDFVLYTFPSLFKAEKTTPPVAPETGRDALLQFHRSWYGEDQLTKTARNTP